MRLQCPRFRSCSKLCGSEKAGTGRSTTTTPVKIIVAMAKIMKAVIAMPIPTISHAPGTGFVSLFCHQRQPTVSDPFFFQADLAQQAEADLGAQGSEWDRAAHPERPKHRTFPFCGPWPARNDLLSGCKAWLTRELSVFSPWKASGPQVLRHTKQPPVSLNWALSSCALYIMIATLEATPPGNKCPWTSTPTHGG